MTLIEVMIASSIMMIGSLAFLEMTTNQQRETASLTQKLASLDLERLLLSALTDSVCKFILTDPSQSGNRSSQTFDSGNANASIGFNYIPSSASSSAVKVAQINTAASPLSTSTYVKTISLTNMVVSSDPNQFKANFMITFDPTKLVKAVKPLYIQTTLQTDPASPANAKLITGCSFDSAGVSAQKRPPGQLLAIHSQTTAYPSCPASFDLLWAGFSYGYATGRGGPGQSQDLAGSGSCLPQFRTLPYTECSNPNACDYMTDDLTYWLSATDTDQSGTTNIGTILNWISKCVVCKSQDPITFVVQHSQSTSVPGYPSGSTLLWNGYSYFFSNGGANSYHSQDLGSPGSCLQQFRSALFVECMNNGCDYYTADDFTYWLYANSVDEPGVTAAVAQSRVSRCSVCYYKTQ